MLSQGVILRTKELANYGTFLIKIVISFLKDLSCFNESTVFLYFYYNRNIDRNICLHKFHFFPYSGDRLIDWYIVDV